METTHRIRRHDLLFVLAGTIVLFGCMASSYRSARTLEPGQVSVGAGYLAALDADDNESDEAMHFASLDARAGVVRGVDFGLAHSWDLTEGTDGTLSTLWGDAKFQLTNNDGDLNKAILSVGLVKGYVYSEEMEDGPRHILGPTLMAGTRINPTTTIGGSYRIDFIGEEFLPESFDSPRHMLTLGGEFALSPPLDGAWTPKMGVGIGYLFGSAWAKKVMLNFGFSIDSPSLPRATTMAQ